MKRLIFIFIIVPRKIFRMIFYKLEYFYYRFCYSKSKMERDFTQKRYLVCGGENFNNIANVYAEIFPDKVHVKIAEADLICQHIFNLLGSGSKKLSQDDQDYQPIDWHSDFKSGFKWNPNTFYSNIKYGHKEGVDIKVPWELSRFQHFNILGQAYLLTKDRKYSDEFANQIQDWIEHNPIAFGVNWHCTMDVAIRAVNWLVAIEYFLDGEEKIFDKEFLNKFYVSIYEHAKFIYRHLESSLFFNSNHYLADIAGLFFIAVYCPFFKESKKWQEFALKELAKEIEKQVYADGCDFEASTSYHRLALEMFFYAELLGRRTGIEFSENYKSKLRKMFDFSLYCIKPNGMIPQIGDNDNGRVLIFCKRPILEHKYLLNLAAIYYKDQEFKGSPFDFNEEVFWIFGKTGKDIYGRTPGRKESLKSKSFPNAGWFIMRSEKDYCFISCGPNGQNGRGGHAHNDKLSFELILGGRDIIVDPGTYVYTPYPKERSKFRSTKYHNTVNFNDYEQSEISKKYIFSLPERVEIKNASLKETKNEIEFEGEIQYLDFSHKRIIKLDKESGNWQIIDSISNLEPVEAKLIFHLSPDVFFDDNCIFSKKTKEKILSIETEDYKLNKEVYEYSPEYGLKTKAECLTANISGTKHKKTITTYIGRV